MPSAGPRLRRALLGALGALVLSLPLAAPAGGNAPAAAPLPALPRVLVIGDSTTVHMQPRFAAELAGQGLDATIDAEVGRTTREGALVLATYDQARFDYVVVLLGANGKRANALRDVTRLRAAGVDTMATVLTPQQEPVNAAVMATFGQDRIKWAGYATARGIAPYDGKHFTAAQYVIRARYIARRIADRVRAAAP